MTSDTDDSAAASLGRALAGLLAGTTELPADELVTTVDVVGRILGARTARILIADYGVTSLQVLGTDESGPDREPIEGTLAGRAFSGSEIVVAGEAPARVMIPLTEGSERLGVLELEHEDWTDDLRTVLGPVIRVLVLILISKRRYTDVLLRSRRSQPLSPAAEMQWDLLPPLSCATSQVAVSGILEPAYSIGGDSFDYALNDGATELAIVDAMGHGMPAVLLSVVAINALRNARREGHDLETAYRTAGDAIQSQLGPAAFATGVLARLDHDRGELTWLNAGHPLPLLVRDGTFVGELPCRPSRPMGLGGEVVQIATTALQPGDRVLLYTDGVIDTRDPAGVAFGLPRLADLLVRASLDGVSPGETVRRLSTSIMAHNGDGLGDDATLLLLTYFGNRAVPDRSA